MANKNNILEPQRSVYYELFTIAQIIAIFIIITNIILLLNSKDGLALEEGKSAESFIWFMGTFLCILIPNFILGIITLITNIFVNAVPTYSMLLFLISALGTVLLIVLAAVGGN